ncbi:hypothetical protein [Arsenicicoccus piscis]|uniref:hypothetical protein n=1 Tax=Arsenicicoccus piscis TaxID=673954 RepID=UPI0024E1970B|nr:hypothetical protein [Arsenicicoccus piscis]
MMASTMPRPTPRIIAPMVPTMVPSSRPLSTGLKFITCSAKPKSHFGFVTNELISMATSTAISASATHRHGCGTGRAWIGPGRSPVPSTGEPPVGATELTGSPGTR